MVSVVFSNSKNAMKLHFVLFFALYLVSSSIYQCSAKRRTNSDIFKGCLRQMKASLRECVTKLISNSSDKEKKPVLQIQKSLNESTNATESKDFQITNTSLAQLDLGNNQTLTEEKAQALSELHDILMNKLRQMPNGKLKMDVLDKFKEELTEIMKEQKPKKGAKGGNLTDSMEKIQTLLIDQLKKEVIEEEVAQRLQADKKARKNAQAQIEREQLKEEKEKMEGILAQDMEKLSKLQFQDTPPSRVCIQLANSTTIRDNILNLMEGLRTSKDMLDEIKRTCKQCQRVYGIDIAATMELTNYLLQNVDLQIDVMTGFMRVIHRQPNLIAGKIQFDFTRFIFEKSVLQKASAEIVEMARSLGGSRPKLYKLNDQNWSLLANRTSNMFFYLNGELSKQNQQLSLQ